MQENSLRISAGILQRQVQLDDGNVSTRHLTVAGTECLAGPARELSFNVSFAEPNRRPQVPSFAQEQDQAIDTTRHFAPETDSTRVAMGDDESAGVRWLPPVAVEAASWDRGFEPADLQITS
ncbi:MAG: hypothetical protein KDM81_04715, partial [Verrucomicrobiae bacterium]|nr:hypothetical protein [Verrucomicrobiae bacterium]